MSISFDEFRTRLKSLELPVFRDKAVEGTPYPYYVYSFSTEKRIMGSSRTALVVTEYRVSLFTTGTERELIPFKKEFSREQYESFTGVPGDENDDTVTNFTTFVDVVARG